MTRDRLLSSARDFADRSRCRPALALLGVFALGIACCRTFPATPGVWCGTAGVIVVASLFGRWVIFEELCLAIAIFLAGLGASQLALYRFPIDDIGLRAGDTPRLVQLEVVILDVPHLQATANPHLPPRQAFIASVSRMFQRQHWTAASGELSASIAKPVDGLAAGQRVRLTGLISRTRPASNPGQFDSSVSSRSRRQLASLMVPHASGVQFIADASPSAKMWGLALSARTNAREALDRGFDLEHVADRRLLGALVFADRPPEMQSQVETFQRAGLLHLLSSNGLRITLLVGMVFLLGRSLRLLPRPLLLGMVGIIVVAALLVQPTPQVLRPALVGAAVTLVILCRRNVDTVQLVSLAALGLLLNNPLDFFAAGFQLSFGIALGMALLARPLVAAIAELDGQDRRMHRQLALRRPPATLWQWIDVRVRPYAVESLKFGLGAWLIATPLILLHFEQFNLWSAPMGWLIAPLAGAALLAGFFKVIATLLFPWAAPLWASIAGWFPALLGHAVDWASRLPGSNVPARAPPVMWVIAWYAALAVVLFYLRRRAAGDKKAGENPDEIVLPDAAAVPQIEVEKTAPDAFKESARNHSLIAHLLSRVFDRLKASVIFDISIRRWAMPIASVVPILGCLLWLFHPLSARAVDGRADTSELRLTLLSVGAGQCAVMQVPGGEVDCFDAGSESMADPWHACLGPYLHHLGRSRADRIFLSHGDFDHISAVPAMLADGAAAEIDMSPHLRHCAPPGDFADRMLRQFKSAGVPTRLIWADRSVGSQPLGNGGATIEVLWPPAKCEMNSNNTGLVLRVTYAGRSILFPADIQEPAERALLNLPPGSLRADVLVAPHHGSSEAATADFIVAVAPRFVICSNGSRLTHKQRNFDDIVKKLPLYRTSRDGAITVRVTREGKLDVQAFAGHPSPSSIGADGDDEFAAFGSGE